MTWSSMEQVYFYTNSQQSLSVLHDRSLLCQIFKVGSTRFNTRLSLSCLVAAACWDRLFPVLNFVVQLAYTECDRRCVHLFLVYSEECGSLKCICGYVSVDYCQLTDNLITFATLRDHVQCTGLYFNTPPLILVLKPISWIKADLAKCEHTIIVYHN